MVTESSLDMLPALRGGGDGEVVGRELGVLLREARSQEAELKVYRSGSAPPTFEGSLSAVGGLFDTVGEPKAGVEEELRSDPSYLSYYYSHNNFSAHLPPTSLSKEDWRAAQRVQTGRSSRGFGGIGDRRKAAANGGSRVENGRGRATFSLPPGFVSRKEESNDEWLEKGGDGLIGLPELGFLGPKKSFDDTLQDDLERSSLLSALPSRPVSRNSFEDFADTTGSNEMQLAQLHHEIASTAKTQKMDSSFQRVSGSISNNFASAAGTLLSRSLTPDPQLIVRVPSPRLPPVGERFDKKNKNGSNTFINSSNGTDSSDLIAALSSLSFSTNGKTDGSGLVQSKMLPDMEAYHNSPFDLLGRQDHIKKPNRSARKSSPYLDNEVAVSVGSNQVYTSFGPGGYPLSPASPSLAGSHLSANKFPPLYDNAANAATSLDSRLSGRLPLHHPYSNVSVADIHALGRMGNHNAIQVSSVDPLYFQCLGSAEYAAEFAPNLNGSPLDRNFMGISYDDRIELQTAYLGALLSQQKSHYGGPLLFKSNALNGDYCGNAAMGLGMSFPGSSLGAGSPIRHNDRHSRFASGMRGFVGGAMNPWHTDMGGNLDEGFSSSLLEEFKSNKTKCFELSEIAGHVVEFSADQYGSRFIQQKLETATMEEKDMVFNEIISQALSLMTDVFGNYVVQKFFEHGSQDQRRELANQLTGHVLTLSLQMYGCRVIQKAIEVIDLDQQTKMVAELEGHIMRCVRDQNGNHVIQKCIECIPQDAIQFIRTSFYDQVVMLSTHPYGCRVIQRVLEHCDDPRTLQIMMEEILQSVCMLAQDQYGNYVVQHVLEHGKPQERSAIIEKLMGQIVQMSQQKFASNVVEKCLTFCTPEERQVLVDEMLGTTDENEPLQAMMKDQFANYVVQKVLETCEDQQRELILSRIKVHLNALKKYTYGKHIVARVEKLVAAGERRTGMQTAYPLS